MDVHPILAQLERNEGHFPKAAIREAIEHRSEIIPPLLGVLEAVARDPQSFASDPKRMIHIYAMYLLAEFRESRAYPLLVQVFSVPGEFPMDLAGDVVTQDLGRILASVSDGDMSGMASLVENERANEYVRGSPEGSRHAGGLRQAQPGRGDGLLPKPVPHAGPNAEQCLE